MMLQFKEAPQHQHPSVLRRKETPAVSNTAEGAIIFVAALLLAVKAVNQHFKRFHWLVCRTGRGDRE